jgi:hypothetical protein
LKILSNSKNTIILNTYIKKIFEAINELVFVFVMKINNVNSPGGEILKLHATVIYDDKVEQWFADIEDKMKKTVELMMSACINDYGKKNRLVWLSSNHISQCMLICTRVYFTESTEKAILDHDLPVLQESCQQSIEELIKLIRGELKLKITP